MTDIPTSAMQNMTLREPDAPLATKEAVVKPPRSPRYKFPPMPADVGTCGRYHFFGFPTTFCALSELAKDYLGPADYPFRSLVSDGVECLRGISRYRYLQIFNGVAQEGDEPLEDDGYIPVIPGEKATLIIGVFVNIRGLEHRRPTRRQMDILIELLGQPRWYKDAWRPEDFDLYCVM